jgi:SAM-dependent methyltransferase
VRRFRHAAFAKVDRPTSHVYDEGVVLVEQLRAIAYESVDGDPTRTREILEYAAETARATFCAGWLWNRAYVKPRGYAGDYLLLQRIYDARVSDDPLGAVMDRSFLVAPSARAVQNRRHLLATILFDFCRRRGPGPIISLGSGPGQELVDLSTRIATSKLDGRWNVICVDHDRRALDHLSLRLLGRKSLRVERRQADVRRLRSGDLPQVDLAYCVGVFDYLSEPQVIRVLHELWRMLAPEGVVVMANFCDRRPSIDRFSMDYIMRWSLEYRDEATLGELIAKTPFSRANTIVHEPEGIGVFAILSKGAPYIPSDTLTTAPPAEKVADGPPR